LNKSVLYQENKKTQIIQVRWHVMKPLQISKPVIIFTDKYYFCCICCIIFLYWTF